MLDAFWFKSEAHEGAPKTGKKGTKQRSLRAIVLNRSKKKLELRMQTITVRATALVPACM